MVWQNKKRETPREAWNVAMGPTNPTCYSFCGWWFFMPLRSFKHSLSIS